MEASTVKLVSRLDEAVEAGSVEEITSRVKDDLERVLSRGDLLLPDRFRQPRPDTYARRLLHRDPRGRYTAIVMTWGPGQGTPVHDHGGLWCVEGVVEGRIAVTGYDVAPDGVGRFRVAARETVRAGRGTAGRLIPPTDYHVIVNDLPDHPSVTLHVYGGELSECRIFAPADDGRFASRTQSLSFHE